MIALIPARAGSKRIPGKNTKLLAGHPLIVYTIAAAKACGVFEGVWCCSDDRDVLEYAEDHCNTFERSAVSDVQSDHAWVMEALKDMDGWYSEFCILRPTSPFRTADTIRRAYAQWQEHKDCCDSLRAVTKASQTPFKMWLSTGPDGYEAAYPMTPLCEGQHPDGTPFHSSPTQTLPTVYVQTGALEMGWTRNVEQLGSISGRKIVPFFTDGPESLDLNTPDDWVRAERLAAENPALLPAVSLARVSAAVEAQ